MPRAPPQSPSASAAPLTSVSTATGTENAPARGSRATRSQRRFGVATMQPKEEERGSRSSGPKLARPSARKPCSACHCFSTASMAARVSVGPRVGTRISPRMSLGPAASRQTHFVPPSSTPATSGASLIGIDARASAALMRDAWPSPRVLAAVVVVEPARVLRSQPFDQPPHGAHALLRRQRRAASAHVGLDPSGVDHDAGDALARQIDRSAAHHHVHRRLGRRGRNVAAGGVVRERPHAAGDRDYRPTRALSDPLEKRFGHARRTQDVYVEHMLPVVVVDRADGLVRLSHDAGAVDQHVDGALVALHGSSLDAACVGDIYIDEAEPALDVRHQAPQRLRGVRISATGENAPAVNGILPREFEPDSAVRSGDQYRVHRGRAPWMSLANQTEYTSPAQVRLSPP